MTAEQDTTPGGFHVALQKGQCEHAAVERVATQGEIQHRFATRPPRHLALIASCSGPVFVVCGWVAWQAGVMPGAILVVWSVCAIVMSVGLAVAFSVMQKIAAAYGPIVVIHRGGEVSFPRRKTLARREDIELVEHVTIVQNDCIERNTVFSVVIVFRATLRREPLEVCCFTTSADAIASAIAGDLGVPLRCCTIYESPEARRRRQMQ